MGLISDLFIKIKYKLFFTYERNFSDLYSRMSEQLPIQEILPELKQKLKTENIIILQAPPGAGKSTVLPLELLNEAWLQGKKILMLEPRRLAARAVASRMASLLDESVGETVGYRVRFENKISKQTRLEVVTEGILTRMLQQDNSLEGVGLVIFDEFHERSLHADLALALCRDIQQVLREDLKMIIMSATLDGQLLSTLLGNSTILTSKGRQYPIRYQYFPQETNTALPLQMARLIRKALEKEEGDILAFLPGSGEIMRTQELLEKELDNVSIYPLYGDLSQQKQQEAILPNSLGGRKIVLATSIAETSLTIEGIKIVVDSGVSRVPRFDLKTGLTKLDTIQVTKDAADQRAGRAGRLGPGVCYRLWSEGTHQHLQPHRTPEILEADLSPTMLELSQWGVQDIRSLTWLTPPSAGSVSQAKELLTQLGAIQNDKITEKGKRILRLPTNPRIAQLLLEGENNNLLALATDVASVLEERDPLPKEAGTNLAERVEILRKWRKKEYVSADRNVLERIERLANAWRKTFRIEADNNNPNYEQVGKLIAAAYPERIARQQEKDLQRYRLANSRIVKLAEHDPLINESWLAVAHLDAGKNEGRIYLAAPLNPKDILHLAYEKEVVNWDTQKGILIARKEKRIGEITVESSPLEKISEEERTKILCEVVKKEGLNLLKWPDNLLQWQARIMNLKSLRPEEEWPDVSPEYLVNHSEKWLTSYLSPIRKREDFQKLDLTSILSALLPWAMSQRLDQLAPDKIKVPSGFAIPLQYFADGSTPVLAVRLQEMFGLLDTPAINEGRNKVMLHLLSPGYKPVQVTQDLKSFWKNTYPEVRKELRMRYPKHHWPEDPWTAEAVRGVKRK
jgi:ATP-dependent helicase HrpB